MLLLPGRARLSTKPAPTGSMRPTNTIGTRGLRAVRPHGQDPEARMRPARRDHSAARRRCRWDGCGPAGVDAHVAADAQPDCCSPCRKAPRRA